MKIDALFPLISISSDDFQAAWNYVIRRNAHDDRYSGVVPGIEFDLGKATIRPGSRPTLDEAASVLTEYSALRILISGHTDDIGDRKKNLELSKERADAVKMYLVGKGIDEKRVETRGAGPDEPIADNEQAAGRQKNRRIEFKLLQ